MPTKTKAQIARKMYGCSLSDLTGGEKAAVTKAYNKQNTATPTATPRRVTATPATGAGFVTVKFGRPGVNGVKECIVAQDATMGQALEQAGVTINKTKEGVLNKSDGAVVMYNNPVKDGAVYMIVPGVDSSDY